ncbi:hypothetical protein JAAARDRAFT_37210 [Jaapia argillacea MUCL 33604]|uniref:BZIP domain-containing protein n=1 Tax=Jaapia argillacea MUCL 33604 TaxID=933084 RepID=A0A067PLL4_9AGAM|nr:hypothetical protein JAAARDRAFT_37210 [Jaapia argillacea MUCL 33604]
MGNATSSSNYTSSFTVVFPLNWCIVTIAKAGASCAMVPPILQGLNIVHPEQPSNPYLSDADLLAQLPPFTDFSAQLDLWTNLSFQSDEPLIRKDDKKGLDLDRSRGSSDDGERYGDEEEDVNTPEGTAPLEAHDNVVVGTHVPNAPVPATAIPPVPAGGVPLDFQALISGFGLDHLIPGGAQNPSPTTPSLAQLLSLYAGQSAAFPTSAPAPPPTPTSTQFQEPSPPVPKRARTRKVSITASEADYASEFPDLDPNTSTPLTAAEDKRRRNTAASARFRLKKKEREQALEKKSKELEGRVNELERECEALRRENGWLKGLVVGVTGVQQKQQSPTTTASATTTTTGKRSRDAAEVSDS